MKQTRKTRWDRLGTVGGKHVDVIKRVNQMDIDSMSLQIRRTSNTRITDSGLIRGEVCDAIVEQRRWGSV